MQTAATEALDISRETAATHTLYGLDDPATREYGTRCLIARAWSSGACASCNCSLAASRGTTTATSAAACRRFASEPTSRAAALVKDLKQRGMLDSTVVHLGGEIGRLPVTENHGDPTKAGRDHNGQGFSMWVAGGGFQPRHDLWRDRRIRPPRRDERRHAERFPGHAVALFGLDHVQLSYLHSGREQQITAGRTARLVQEIIKG